MRLFLTSSPCLGYAGDILTDNGFLERLREALTAQPIRCVMITSAPDDVEMTDRMAWELREMFERAGMPFAHYEVLDRRTQAFAARMLRRANFIILCGGHVPTQNRFFEELDLRRKLRRFEGNIMSISAGSMNCADVVYASPELEGESIDPSYRRYLQGLALTQLNILPHYYMIKDEVIDGKRLIQEIVAADSYRLPVWCLADGSYFLIEQGRTELFGEAYLMKEGRFRQVSRNGDHLLVCRNGRLKQL